jgi:orotidine-5'-phosphate decarboxylase
MTVNLTGRDALGPFSPPAARGRGCSAWSRLERGQGGRAGPTLSDGRPLWHGVASLVNELGQELTGSRGLSNVGAVVGATILGRWGRRRSMPQAILLLPGVGAQGRHACRSRPRLHQRPGERARQHPRRAVLYAFRASGEDWRTAATAAGRQSCGAIWAVSGW